MKLAQLYALTRVSQNAKTGPIPTSMTSASSCPISCPLKGNGCYAGTGHVALHWRKLSEGKKGVDLLQFCNEIRALPRKQLWRHDVAGDLPGHGNRIDALKLDMIASANKGRKGFTYTHKPDTAHNLKAIRKANDKGFTINLSANGLRDADRLAAHGLPVVTVLPIDAPALSITPEGRKVLSCPAYRKDTITCSNCGICQMKDRKFIVGFPAHGASKKKASALALAN